LGDRAILFYNFVKEGDILEETLKKVLPKDAKVWRIDGKTHDIPTEQTCGKRDVILVQWQAGSMGLNLQFVNCWLSVTPNYSWTISTQARGRIKRIGQKRPMFFFYFMCDNTIEQSIYDCLKNKCDFAEDAWLNN
jgi:SNF2 family DNA or RNA helicase